MSTTVRCPGTLDKAACEWATTGGCTTPCVKREPGLTTLRCTSSVVYGTPHQPHPWTWASSDDQTPRYWCEGWRPDAPIEETPTRRLPRVIICDTSGALTGGPR